MLYVFVESRRIKRWAIVSLAHFWITGPNMVNVFCIFSITRSAVVVLIMWTIGIRLYSSKITNNLPPLRRGPWKSAEMSHHGAVGSGDSFGGSGLLLEITAWQARHVETVLSTSVLSAGQKTFERSRLFVFVYPKFPWLAMFIAHF